MVSSARLNIWGVYSNTWSEPDAGRRRQMFEQCLSPDCTYTDPHIQAIGYDNLSGYITEFQKNVPGGKFVVTDFKEHHDRSLAHWDMLDGTGKTIGRGASFALYGSDGRLKQMTGFFDPPNAG